MTVKTRPLTTKEKKQAAKIEALIDEAIEDSKDNQEAFCGFSNMICECVEVPFVAKVIGQPVKIIDFEESDQSFGMKAVCQVDKKKL